MAENELTQLVFQLTQNQVDIVKSINFGRGVATKAQLAKERKLIKAMTKFGVSEEEYFKLAENS